MELWIRSQNKEILTQVDNVCLDDFVNYDGIDVITKIKPSDKCVKLGTYKTKKRALEILDEIQKIVGWIQKDMKYTTIGEVNHLIGCYDNYVYEMPEE